MNTILSANKRWFFFGFFKSDPRQPRPTHFLREKPWGRGCDPCRCTKGSRPLGTSIQPRPQGLLVFQNVRPHFEKKRRLWDQVSLRTADVFPVVASLPLLSRPEIRLRFAGIASYGKDGCRQKSRSRFQSFDPFGQRRGSITQTKRIEALATRM